MDVKTPTAAVIVVGNEVLSAKVADENGPYARALCARAGCSCTPPHLPRPAGAVAEAVARERARVDWLFTAGGVGPTHDDVTLPAVARALGRGLAREPRLAAETSAAGTCATARSRAARGGAADGRRAGGDAARSVTRPSRSWWWRTW